MDLCCFAYPAESADGAVDLTRDAGGAGVRVDEDTVLVEVAYGRLAVRGEPVAARRVVAGVVAPERAGIPLFRLP